MTLDQRVKELVEKERKLKIAWEIITSMTDTTLMTVIMTAWKTK